MKNRKAEKEFLLLIIQLQFLGLIISTNTVFQEKIRPGVSVDKFYSSPSNHNTMNEPLTTIAQEQNIYFDESSQFSKSPVKSSPGTSHKPPLTPKPSDKQLEYEDSGSKSNASNLLALGLKEMSSFDAIERNYKPRKSSIGRLNFEQGEAPVVSEIVEPKKYIKIPVKASLIGPKDDFSNKQSNQNVIELKTNHFAQEMENQTNKSEQKKPMDDGEIEHSTYVLNFLNALPQISTSKYIGKTNSAFFPSEAEITRRSKRRSMNFHSIINNGEVSEDINEKYKDFTQNFENRYPKSSVDSSSKSSKNLIQDSKKQLEMFDSSTKQKNAQIDYQSIDFAEQLKLETLDKEISSFQSNPVSSSGPIDKYLKDSKRKSQLLKNNKEKYEEKRKSGSNLEKMIIDKSEDDGYKQMAKKANQTLNNSSFQTDQQKLETETRKNDSKQDVNKDFTPPSKVDADEKEKSSKEKSDQRIDRQIELSSGRKKKDKNDQNLGKKTLTIQPKVSQQLSFEQISVIGNQPLPTPLSTHYYNEITFIRQKMDKMDEVMSSFNKDSESTLPLDFSEYYNQSESMTNFKLKEFLANKILYTAELTKKVKKAKESVSQMQKLKVFFDEHLFLLNNGKTTTTVPSEIYSKLFFIFNRFFFLKLMKIEFLASDQSIRYSITYKNCLVMKFDTFVEVKTIKALQLYCIDDSCIQHLDKASRSLICEVLIGNFQNHTKIVDNVSLIDSIRNICTHFDDLLVILDVLDNITNEGRIKTYELETSGAFAIKASLIKNPDIMLKVRFETNGDLKWTISVDMDEIEKETAHLYFKRIPKFLDIARIIIDKNFNQNLSPLREKLDKTMFELTSIQFFNLG